MARVTIDRRLEIALAHLCCKPILGDDLGEIRSRVLNITQEELGQILGASRTRIALIEKRGEVPSRMALFAYIGVLTIRFLEFDGKAKRGKPILGQDLAKLRQSLFGLTPEELGATFGVSVARVEVIELPEDVPDRMALLAYLGALTIHFFEKEGKSPMLSLIPGVEYADSACAA